MTATEPPIGYGQELYDELDALGLSSAARILDAGAGAGAASDRFALRGAQVTALDTSSEALAAYTARIPAVTAASGDLLQLPFANAAFDAVLLARVLHLVDPVAALREALRVVRPGGRVAVWWRELGTGEPLRALRAGVSAGLGLEPLPDEAPPGFAPFYAVPFADRSLRVIPMVARFATVRWLAEERAAGIAERVYGTGAAESYYAALERALGAAAADGAVMARFVQFVYVGVRG